jgi:aryl-alcohol dehydrogenase-like predicted oxidoreductase
LAQGPDVAPIPGTKRRKFLEENVASANITLTPADLDRLNKAAPIGGTAGTRYQEAVMAKLDR